MDIGDVRNHIVSCVVLLSIAILSPATSPVSSIADFDGDGVPDSSDVFPSDPHEWKDSDGDGIGDRADFMDAGDGGIRITLLSFKFEGYLSSYNRIKYCPDAFFKILVDVDCYGDFDRSYESDIFCCMECTETFFTADCGLKGDATAVRFSIVAYDVWDVDNNVVTDFEILDYMPLDGVRADEQTLSLPCSDTWFYSGEGDNDTPGCALEYMISTIAL